jgi:hypothetical protein
MFASPSVILIFLLVFLNFTAFRFLLVLLMLAFDLSSLILGSGGNCSRSFRMQKLATKLKRIQLAPFAMNFLYRYFWLSFFSLLLDERNYCFFSARQP